MLETATKDTFSLYDRYSRYCSYEPGRTTKMTVRKDLMPPESVWAVLEGIPKENFEGF